MRRRRAGTGRGRSGCSAGRGFESGGVLGGAVRAPVRAAADRGVPPPPPSVGRRGGAGKGGLGGSGEPGRRCGCGGGVEAAGRNRAWEEGWQWRAGSDPAGRDRRRVGHWQRGAARRHLLLVRPCTEQPSTRAGGSPLPAPRLKLWAQPKCPTCVAAHRLAYQIIYTSIYKNHHSYPGPSASLRIPDADSDIWNLALYDIIGFL